MFKILLYLYVCLSNFYGFYAYFNEENLLLKYGLLSSMFASFIMHVYEIKRFTQDLHISKLKKDNLYNTLVFFDKLIAYTTIAMYVYFKYNIVMKYLIYNIFAILLCILSTEINLSKNNVYIFAILHGTWHIFAFNLAYIFSRS